MSSSVACGYSCSPLLASCTKYVYAEVAAAVAKLVVAMALVLKRDVRGLTGR